LRNSSYEYKVGSFSLFSRVYKILVIISTALEKDKIEGEGGGGGGVGGGKNGGGSGIGVGIGGGGEASRACCWNASEPFTTIPL
jgi:hypothetical protein